MSIKRELFGELFNSQQVYAYTLSNRHNISVRIITYGGIVTHIYVPNAEGKRENVVMGFDNLEGYINKQYIRNCPYFGAIIGRYANRINKGKFKIGNTVCKVTANSEKNHLHGGRNGFDKVLWKSHPMEHEQWDALQLSYVSRDGEEGFPGEVRVDVTYVLNDANELIFYAEAQNTSEKATPVNLTNHSYFNLSGMRYPVKEHELLINSRYYLKAHKGIPTGEYVDVNEDKPFNFRDLTKIGDKFVLQRNGNNGPVGFDHNYVIDKPSGELRFAAKVQDRRSRRAMLLFTNKPGMQFYTANGLNGEFIGNHGKPYQPREALCLEPQYFPDTPNHAKFGNSILKGGETYEHVTVYKFLY